MPPLLRRMHLSKKYVRQRRKVKHVLKAPYSVFSVVFSPDGKQLASGGILNRTVSIWDVASGKLVRELTDAVGSVESLAYSPDGKYLASGRGAVPKLSVNIGDAQTGQLLRNLSGPVPPGGLECCEIPCVQP